MLSTGTQFKILLFSKELKANFTLSATSKLIVVYKSINFLIHITLFIRIFDTLVQLIVQIMTIGDIVFLW